MEDCFLNSCFILSVIQHVIYSYNSACHLLWQFVSAIILYQYCYLLSVFWTDDYRLTKPCTSPYETAFLWYRPLDHSRSCILPSPSLHIELRWNLPWNAQSKHIGLTHFTDSPSVRVPMCSPKERPIFLVLHVTCDSHWNVLQSGRGWSCTNA